MPLPVPQPIVAVLVPPEPPLNGADLVTFLACASREGAGVYLTCEQCKDVAGYVAGLVSEGMPMGEDGQ